MESTRLTGQGIRDLNDRGPKKKPAPADVPAPDTGGEQPVAAAAAEADAGKEANDAPGVPTPMTEVATAEHQDG